MTFRKDSLKELRGQNSIEAFLRDNKIECTIGTWSNWENGVRVPRACMIGYLASIFEKKLDFFYS